MIIYSTALSLTIAIGIVLLTINGLIFGAVYYYINKHKVDQSRSKFSSVRYVDIQSGLDGHSNDTTTLGDHHYAGFCCENHHLCPFTAETSSHHLSHHHIHHNDSSSPLRSPPPPTQDIHHDHPHLHPQQTTNTSSGSSHVSLQPSSGITVASLNQSTMSPPGSQVTPCSQQQQQLTSSNHQGSPSINGSCESKVTCQCDSCYHQQSICDNGHCLTVIHEFDEHL